VWARFGQRAGVARRVPVLAGRAGGHRFLQRAAGVSARAIERVGSNWEGERALRTVMVAGSVHGLCSVPEQECNLTRKRRTAPTARTIAGAGQARWASGSEQPRAGARRDSEGGGRRMSVGGLRMSFKNCGLCQAWNAALVDLDPTANNRGRASRYCVSKAIQQQPALQCVRVSAEMRTKGRKKRCEASAAAVWRKQHLLRLARGNDC
jgi:hypothetical protein